MLELHLVCTVKAHREAGKQQVLLRRCVRRHGAIAWNSKLLYFGTRVPASCSCICPYCASYYRPMSFIEERAAALKPQAESARGSLTVPTSKEK
jgi:hypothetical protein